MPQRNLPDFLERLGQAGELVRVDAPVDPQLEIAEVTERIVKSGGPALLFGNVDGHDMPVLTNLLGAEERIARALDIERMAELTQRMATTVSAGESEGWFERLKPGPQESALRRHLPRSVRSGAVQQVVRLGRDINLEDLPLLQTWPDEPQHWITAGQVWTTDFESGRRVIGRYDLARLDRDRLALATCDYEEPARLLREAAGHGRTEHPVAVVLGGDPVTLLAASAPLPAGIDVSGLAGFWREKPLELVKCRSVDLDVPADAEIVIEGCIDTRAPWVALGAACTASGRYGRPSSAPVLRVTAVTHRANPVFPAVVRGRPPHEDTVIARALRKILLPVVRQALPELVDYDLPPCGAVRHWAFLAIRKTYAGQARKVAQAAWSFDPLMLAKILVIVDEDVDVHNLAAVLAAIAGNVRPERDVIHHSGPGDPQDAAGASDALSERLAFDATTKLPGEHAGAWSGWARMDARIIERVTSRWPEYGLGPLPDARSK